MEYKGSLPCSQDAVTDPYSTTDESTPQSPTLSILDSLHYSPIYDLVSQADPLSDFIMKIVISILISPVRATIPTFLSHSFHERKKGFRISS